MRTLASIRKKLRGTQTVLPVKVIDPSLKSQTRILPAMDIGLQILASMDPQEARRLHRKLKKP